MKYSLADLPALAATPLGRFQLRWGVAYRAWPLLRRVAGLYRRTFLRRTQLIAVVGSCGKSTTVRTTQAVLGVPRAEKLPVNAFSGLALALLKVRRGARFAVLEAGLARPGQMEPYARMLAPNTVVVTAIGTDHRRSFETLEATRSEKARMVEALRSDGLAVLNGDDPNVLWMRGRTDARILTYGFDEGNDVRGAAPEIDWPHSTRFRVSVDGEEHEATIRMFGRPMLLSALAGLAVAHGHGVDLGAAIAALSELEPTPGRLHPVPLACGAILIRDDWKSAEETMLAAFDLLEQVPARRKIVLMGGIEEPRMPVRARYRHVAERLAACADRAYIMGRRDDYARGAVAAGMPPEALIEAPKDIDDLVAQIGADLGPGDVLLVKGRGSERVERVSLALQGVAVGCKVEFCSATRRCDGCPMLERGWGDKRIVM